MKSYFIFEIWFIDTHQIWSQIVPVFERNGVLDFIQLISIVKLFAVDDGIPDEVTQLKFKANILSDFSHGVSLILVIFLLSEVHEIHLFCSVGTHHEREILQVSESFAYLLLHVDSGVFKPKVIVLIFSP